MNVKLHLGQVRACCRRSALFVLYVIFIKIAKNSQNRLDITAKYSIINLGNVFRLYSILANKYSIGENNEILF
jgi:hypothetical protein